MSMPDCTVFPTARTSPSPRTSPRLSPRTSPRLAAGFGTAAVLVGMITGPAAPAALAAAPTAHPLGVQLTSEHDALGAGTALIVGPSLVSTPSPSYVDAVDRLYLAPHGFTGTLQALTTPESPINLAGSMDSGAEALTAAIQHQISLGDVDAANPVVVFAYSQSAAFVTDTMQQLHQAGVPSEDVHFVLVGDPAAPNGGWLTSIDFDGGPSTNIPLLNIPIGGATPDDLYPTDVYTMEYDGFADHAHYPIDLLSFVNSMFGLFFNHLAYLGLTPEQVADAIPLATTGDGMVDYYGIPSQSLPLLVPLQLLPGGQPLYDLMEPMLRVLVNLGYGDTDSGFNIGPANVPTPDATIPPNFDAAEVLAELGKASSAGVSAFMAALDDPTTFQPANLMDIPAVSTLIAAEYGAGFIAEAHPTSIGDALGALVDNLWGAMSQAMAEAMGGVAA